MKCYSANLIDPITASGSGEDRVVVFKGKVGKTRISNVNGFEDYEGLAGLEEFGTAIEELKIGQPIGRNTLNRLVNEIEEIPEELLALDLPEEHIEISEGNNLFSQVGAVCFIQVNSEKTEM